MPRISSHRYQIDVVIGVSGTLVLRKSQQVRNPDGLKSRGPEGQWPEIQKADSRKSRWQEGR